VKHIGELEVSSNVPVLRVAINRPCEMNSASKTNCFSAGIAAPGESRFEKIEADGLGGPVHAHFVRKLQAVFPVPSQGSEPEDVRILLRELQTKLSGITAPAGMGRTQPVKHPVRNFAKGPVSGDCPAKKPA